MSLDARRRVIRRARPMLGTLVEIGLVVEASTAPPQGLADGTQRALDTAWSCIARLQARLSRHEATSDLGRFHALAPGASLDVSPDTARVLATAARLQHASGGAFDVSQGRGGWRLDGRRLTRLHDRARLDLDGIAKGHVVDRAVAALRGAGIAHGWVNAGGDLRVFGDVDVPVRLRDERAGGVRELCRLGDGAIATSRFAADSRSRLWTAECSRSPARSDTADTVAHVSVAAPCCLWADALTKIIAATGRLDHPLLARHRARAWRH